MSDQITTSVVRIFSEDEKVTGAGFLVSEKHILTCAHVIAQALNNPQNKSDAPTSKIHLDFPFLPIGQKLMARVLFWQPTQTGISGTQVAEEDIAVLELESDPPLGSQIAHLVTSDNLWGHSFRAFGFPTAHDQGVWASGRLLAEQAGGLVQIEDVKRTGYFVEPGFSGTAVWDEQTDGIVGMVVASESRPEVRAAFVIPATTLVKVWPELAKRAIPPCPYRGLFAFREKDAQFFFGRDDFTGKLVKAVCEKSLVVVIGPSGSGKSSVVFAGLLHILRQEGEWLSTDFRPGDRPIRALTAALIPLLEPEMSKIDRLSEIGKLTTKLHDGDLKLQDVVGQILQDNPGADLLLVADQFEELYTLCQEDKQRERFLNRLLEAVKTYSHSQTSKFTLVLTVRADFLGSILSYRPFADALQDADLKLGPMNRRELQDAVEKPAHKLGVEFEEGLTERILEAVNEEPGDLPLLEFALTQLWARQTNNKMTHAAYDKIGGIEKALTRYAEEVYEGLSEDDQKKAQSVFVQLVRPGEGTEDTRRIAVRNEIAEGKWGLITRLASKRLVVTGRDKSTGKETVEVAHEALIHNWGRLKGWMNEDREFLLWRQRLRAHFEEWERAEREKGTLLRGAPLTEAESWLIERADDINPTEQDFIKKSTALREQEQAAVKAAEREKETSRQRELALAQDLAEEQHQRARLFRQLTAVLVVMFSVAVGLAVYAFIQRKDAIGQREIALARQLAAQAELIRNEDASLLTRSVLLAVESMRRFPSLEGDQALRHGLALLPRAILCLDHESELLSVTFSPDGDLLATASMDGTARLWEVTSGEQLRVVKHDGEVLSVTFSPDGDLLATASMDGTARLWEVTSGEQLRVVKHDGEVLSVTFSQDGKYLATASVDKTAVLWETTSGKEVARMSHQNELRSVTFSPDGKYLATASLDNTARLWEVPSGKEVARMNHEDEVYSITFSSKGKLLATASRDRTARLWEVPSGKEIARMNHEHEVLFVAFSPNGEYLATASKDYSARLWEAPSGKETARMLHEHDVLFVTFSPDGKYLATASLDKTARLWEATSGKEIARMPHEREVPSVAFSPEGMYLATASLDRTARLWEARSGEEVIFINLKSFVYSVTFSPDGKYLATASEDGTAQVREATSGKEVARMKHEDRVLSVALSPDGKYLATASLDSTTRLWEATSGKEVRHMIYDANVYSIAFSPDGRYLATASEDRTARLWEAKSGKEIRHMKHDDKVYFVIFSPNGRYLATASGDTARLWEATSGKEVARINHEDRVYSVAFSPDGRYLATASLDSTARLWEAISGKEISRMIHEDTVFSVAFSPDGKHLATASLDKTARLWEATRGKEIARMTHENRVLSVAFSPDGKYLATASWDTVWIWYRWPQDLINEACSRLIRNLTFEEWQRYLLDEPYRKTCPNLPIHPSFIEAGRNLARAGDIEGAVTIFRRALEHEPTLDLDPEAEAQKLAAEALLKEGHP